MPAESQNTTANPAARVVSASSPGGTGSMMGGTGMAGGAGQRSGVSDGSHQSPVFLHTTDQGDEIVGDLGTVAPPVIGETDPTADPDIELRI